MMRIKLTILLILFGITLNSYSEEKIQKKSTISMGVDLASMYLWRGFDLGNGPAIQPWGEFSYKNFAFGSWGSYELTGTFKEVDLYAKYTHKDFSLLFTDLFFPGFEGLNQNYFNFKNQTTGHCAELGLSFNGSEKVPLSIYGGFILYGVAHDSGSVNTGKVNHSPYLEVKYLGTLNDCAYNIFAGFTPVKSTLYQTDGPAVFNFGLGAQKSVKVTPDFTFPVKLTLGSNPVIGKIYLAVIISL